MAHVQLIHKLRDRKRSIAACVARLLFLQPMLSLPLASPGFDEPYDIARGYA